MASGLRRSELHVLRFDTVRRQEIGGSMVLYPDVQFIAKSHLADGGDGILQPVVITAQ